MKRNQNLNDLFNNETLSISDFIHVAIDVDWCPHSEQTSKELIINNIAPTFQKACIPTYWVYFVTPMLIDGLTRDDFEWARQKLNKTINQPLPVNDRLIPKTSESAFKGGPLNEYLCENSKKILIVDGFQAPYCVRSTVRDAIGNYEVVVLSDAINQNYESDRAALSSMKEMGAICVTSEEFFRHLRLLQNCSAPQFVETVDPASCKPVPQNRNIFMRLGAIVGFG